MNGAAAGSCARTSSVAGRHSAVKSQPRKLKGPGAFRLPAHAISTKNKHLLAIYSIPTRGFTAAVSVFRGTPPAKPLICKSKIRLARLGDAVFRSWADPTGEASLLVLAKFKFVARRHHLDVALFLFTDCPSFVVTRSHSCCSGKIKNPACISASRVEKVLFRSLPACRESIQFGLLFRCGPG